MPRLALVLAFLVAAAPLAYADDDSAEKAQARLLLSQGNAYFERGDLRAALVNFRAAYTAYPSPKLLINAAAAERELGDIAGAATDLRHFLDDASDDDQALVDRARSDLKSLEKKLARIGLGGWPSRSTLEIDGRAARDPTYVKPGPHSARGTTPQGAELSRDLDVNAGDAVELPVPPPPKVSPRSVNLNLSSSSTVVTHKPSKKALAIGLGVAGAVVLVGVGLGVGLYFYFANQPGQPLSDPLGKLHWPTDFM